MLPSNTAGPTTQEVGFFTATPARLARWLVVGLGDDWSIRSPSWTTAEEAFAALAPKPLLSTYAWVPLDDDWSLLLNDTPLGTDVGLLPSRAAEALGCRAIRATCVEGDGTFPARILEVYGPAGEAPFGLERSLTAANDGGRWVFEMSGEPFSFEDQEAYKRRATASRFTSEMLLDYLRQLGVPSGVDPRWSAAVIVERRQ